MICFLTISLWVQLKVTHLSQYPSINLTPLVIYRRWLFCSPRFLLVPLMLQNFWTFGKRSKLVIIIKHFCVLLYLIRNGGLCGTVGYGPELLLKKHFERLQVCRSACEWTKRKSDRLRWNLKSRLIGNGKWRWKGKKFSILCVIQVKKMRTRQTFQLLKYLLFLTTAKQNPQYWIA